MINPARAISMLLCAALLLGAAWIACAQEPAGKKSGPESKSVDDALLEDLDNELLEGVGGMKKDQAPKPPASDAPQERPEGPLADDRDPGMPDPEEDPLGYISQEMRQVEQLLRERAKRAQTEQLQQRIIDDLAKLIERAEQQRSQQAAQAQKQGQQQSRRQTVQQPKPSGSNPNQTSNNPAADSTARVGQTEAAKPDPDLFKGLLKDTWGNLPEREREQMLQSSREKFLPQYELLIERYYRRLAEERTK